MSLEARTNNKQPGPSADLRPQFLFISLLARPAFLFIEHESSPIDSMLTAFYYRICPGLYALFCSSSPVKTFPIPL